MRTRLVLAVLPVTLLGVAAASASAAPKPKPFTEQYEASAPAPGLDFACDGTVPMGQDLHEVKIPAAGKVTIDLSDFLGDWDLLVSGDGKDLGASEEVQPLTDGESVTVKVKKAVVLTINACNYNGGPTGTVKVAYTP